MSYSDPGAVTGGVTPVRGTWGNAVRDDLVDHESRITTVEARVELFKATVPLTDAQIKTLPTPATYVTLVGAPGASELILPLSVMIGLNSSAGAYTAINATYSELFIGWAGGDYAAPSLFTDSGQSTTALDAFLGVASRRFWLPVMVGGGFFDYYGVAAGDTPENYSQVRANNVGKALVIGANNGGANFTGGNGANVMTVVVHYLKATLP